MGTAFLLSLVSALAQQASGCAACHAPERDAEAGGAHAKSAACVDCHGGDPKETDKDRAHGTGFLRKIDRRAVPTLCARCHSDARRMNPYGLATDQLAQYLTSRHGESLSKGNVQAAVCTDCHGTHGIRRARDPTSPVYPTQVPGTCGKCHGKRELMEKLGHSWDAEERYRQGVHGTLLLMKGDLSAPHCATCHGNHGAAPPGFAEVGLVCGKCHGRQAEFFAESPHAFYAKDGSFKACVACHDNHRIVAAPEQIAGRCAPCHEAPDKEMKKFAALGAILAGARKDFRHTRDRLDLATRSGLPTEDEELALEGAQTSFLQLPPLQHTLSEPKIAAMAAATAARTAEIDASLNLRERAERMKKLSLVPLWLFLGALAWVFRLRGRQIERNEK